MKDLLENSGKVLESYNLVQSYKKSIEKEISDYLSWLSCYIAQLKNEIHKTLTNFICVETFDFLLFTNSINCIKINVKIDRDLSLDKSSYIFRISLTYRDIENRDSIYECNYDNNSCTVSYSTTYGNIKEIKNIELKEFTEFFIGKLKEINEGKIIAD